MADFILHHYQFSPYSEKVRSMLAYAELDWHSVTHKEMPPRPLLSPLVGNYGRIPVAQIGADVFCDSNLIAEEIAVLANKPELSFQNSSQEIKDFVQHVEGKIFFAGVLAGGSNELRKKIRKTMSLWDLGRFFVDRTIMGFSATTENMIKPTEARKVLNEHLESLEERLQSDFIFGDSPTLADFSCYHSLWFARDLGEKPFMKKYKKINAWMDRVKALGQTKMQDMDGEAALKIAKESSVRVYPDLGEAKVIAVGPSDYRQKATEGKLVYEDETRWVLSRQHPKCGEIQIHFPKLAYTAR